jgi:ankyrin repeat protein
MSTDLLISAVIANDWTAVEKLLSRTKNPNCCLDSDQITPLHFAAQHNAHQSAKILLKFGADPKLQTNPDQYTALEIAQLHNSKEVIELLSNL